MKTEKTDLLVIGAGPAGISAALYARRGGLAVTVVTKGIETGGLAKAEKIENYYGFAEPISGKELLRRGAAGAERLGVQIVEDELLALSFNDTFDGFKAQAQQHEWEAPAVVLAAGASRRTLPIPGVAEFEGRGVSYCAICDAFFYRGKRVAVIGSGEYALHEAQVLQPHAGKVMLLTNGEPLQAPVPDAIEVRTQKLASVEGGDRVTGVRFEDGTELPLDGIFLAIGTAGSSERARSEPCSTARMSRWTRSKRRMCRGSSPRATAQAVCCRLQRPSTRAPWPGSRPCAMCALSAAANDVLAMAGLREC